MPTSDHVQLSFYRLRFELAFLRKKGEEFQAWFQELAARAYGPDFERVRPYGRQGDHKCDGRRISTGTIFQVYAPDNLRASTLEAKIEDDFGGALQHWPDMRIWTLVTNDDRGLPPSTSHLLDDLRGDNPRVAIEHWSMPDLQRLTREFSLDDWREIFGEAPASADWDQLAVPDIKEVLDTLETRQTEAGQEPLNPPRADKLDRNELSAATDVLLRAGRLKEPLVEQYLRRTPKADLGERIAEAFRQRYVALRDAGTSPDGIFQALYEYTGAMTGLPNRQVAGLAVLSYYFERCDIFEDPEPQ